MALYKRGGVWWMDVYQGSGRKRIRKSTGTRDQTQARMIEQAAIAVNRGISTRQRAMSIIDAILPIDDQSLKVDDAREYYIKCLKDENIVLAETTLEARVNIVSSFAEWAKKNTRTEFVEDVDAHTVFAFVQELNKRPIKTKTKNAYIGDLITVWKMFEKRSKTRQNPWKNARFQRKREEEKHGRAFTENEIDRLRTVARQVGFGWEAMIDIGLYTGLRQSDCANLKWSEIDFEKNVIDLEPSKTKRFKTRVIIPLHWKLKKILMCIRTNHDKVMSGTQVYPECKSEKYATFVLPDRCGSLDNRKYPEGDCSFNEIIRRAKIVAGAEDDLSFHCLRHTFVSRLAEAGVAEEVRMRLAGHTSEQTHQVYTHDDVSARKAIDKLQ